MGPLFRASALQSLTAISAPSGRKLLEERDKARRDSRLKARYLSYRLNAPTGDESTMLLTVDDYQRMGFEAGACSYRETNCCDRSRRLACVERGASRCTRMGDRGAGNMSGDTLSRGSGSPRSGCSRDVHTVSRPGCFGSSAGLRVPPPALLVDLISATWGPAGGNRLRPFRIDELRDTRSIAPYRRE